MPTRDKGVKPIDSAAWMANNRMRVFGCREPGKLLIKFLLWNGRPIQWVVEVLVLLYGLTGSVWGLDYQSKAPIAATLPMWQQWRFQGYLTMMEMVVSQLERVEYAPPEVRGLKTSEYSGGNSPVGNLFYYPSRLFRTISQVITRVKDGWRPALSLDPWRGPEGQQEPDFLDEQVQISYPPGFLEQEHSSRDDVFSSQLRTWQDLLTIPHLLSSLTAFEDEHRSLFMGAFRDIQSHPAAAERLEQLFRQLPVRDLYYREHGVRSIRSQYPTCSSCSPTLVFTSPLDMICRNRKELRALASQYDTRTLSSAFNSTAGNW